MQRENDLFKYYVVFYIVTNACGVEGCNFMVATFN